MGGMNLIYPVVGSSSGTWGTLLNAALALVEDHDHSSGKGVKVPSAGLRINADLAASDAGTSYAITALKAIDFAPSATSGMTGYAGALFVNSADNELYFRTTGGTNVKMTSGTTLNVSIVGGIGGDYAAAGALLSYVDADDRYTLQQQGSPRPWAGVAIGNLDVYEQAASITNRVRIKSPSGLAASYDLTLLTALPGTTTPLQVTSGGQISATNTFSNATTFSSSVTLAVNQNLVQSGTGEHKHGDKILPTPPIQGFAAAGSIAANSNLIVLSTAASETWVWPIKGLIVGDRIRSVQIRFKRNTGTPVLSLLRKAGSGSVTTVASTNVTTGALQTVSIPSVDFTLSALDVLYLSLTTAANLEEIHAADVTFDHP